MTSTIHLFLSAGLIAVVGTHASPAAPETIRPVFRQILPRAPGRVLTVAEVTFAPGTRAEPHRHGAASVYAYVLSGIVRSQLAGGPIRTYHEGEGWFEAPGTRHLLTENVSRNRPARLLVTFLADDGAPLKTPDTAQDRPMQEHANLPIATDNDLALPAPTPQKMVDALYSAFGDHHSRAVHAKGIMAKGYFTPADGANSLSKASIFTSGILPVLIRFSDFTGIPAIPDTAPGGNPRGLAVKFTLPDATTADVIAHSFNGFPTATAAEFRELLLAIGASSGAIKPTPLDQFLSGHPVAKVFLSTQKPASESYATLAYFGVNTFAMTNASGKEEYVRYQFVPSEGEQFLDAAQLSSKGPDYLQDELRARLSRGPFSFTWYAQLAGPDDIVGNPSIAWPESRARVKLGVITIDRLGLNTVEADKTVRFTPLNIPPGIAPADPMLDVRQAAYPLSSHHRQ